MSDERDPPHEEPSARPECLCLGLGPELTRILLRRGPDDEVWQHLYAAQVEILRAIRALLDGRLDRLSHEGPKGTKVPVE